MGLLGNDIEYQMSRVRRGEGEGDEQLARRMYYLQMEVLSANAGCDLVTNDPLDPFRFENLDADTREGWLRKARGK